MIRTASPAIALGTAVIALALGIGQCYAKFDPPRIILPINPPNANGAAAGQMEGRRFYIDRGLDLSINKDDVLNVYREKRLSRKIPRPIRIFIGTMVITDSHEGSSIGEFRPNAAAMAQAVIKHKTAMKGDIVVPRLMIDSSVLFDAGSAGFKRGVVEEFAKVAEFVRLFTPSKLIIEGHTDSDGDPGSNLRLSEARAKAIRSYLITTYSFITSAMVEAKGYGEARPIVSNDTDENKALNRRIEVLVWE